MGWTSKPSAVCSATMTLDSHSAPTPTLQGRSKTRQHKRWAASWRKSDKILHIKRSIGAEVTSAPMLFHPFLAFRYVGQGVGQNLPHTLTYNVCGVSITKKHRKPKFSMLFGAGGVTRTPDLWLLVRMHTGDLLMIFRHLQRLLCNSILHNHALVDIYLVKENCTIKLLVHISVML